MLMMFVMQFIAAANKSEYGIGIDIDVQRQSELQENRLNSDDVRPGEVSGNKHRIKNHTTEVIQRGNQPPFFFSRWRPKMIRRIVLNKFADVMGDNFTVMDFGLLGFIDIKTMFFGAIDNGG